VPPDEYDGSTCAGTAMQPNATNTIANCYYYRPTCNTRHEIQCVRRIPVANVTEICNEFLSRRPAFSVDKPSKEESRVLL